MKRFLLTSLLLLAMGRNAFSYINDRVVIVPTMDPELIQIDDPIFVNHNYFSVDTTLFQFPVGTEAPILYETSSTLNVTNTGTLVSIPGFDFENFPASIGKPGMLQNFVNTANGVGGGVIAATNIFFGLNPFLGRGTFGGEYNTLVGGLAQIRVRAQNVVNSGLLTVDSTGLIDIIGNDVNINRGQVLMSNPGGQTTLDYGGGGFGTNTGIWAPATDLQPGFTISPVFTNFQGIVEQMALFNSTPYFETLTPVTNNNTIVWRVIFLQDSSPTNVSASVFFGNSIAGPGEFHIQWQGVRRDPLTGAPATNYFVLSDDPAARRGPFFFQIPNQIPADFSFDQSDTPVITGPFATPGYTADPFAIAGTTNDFTYISVQPTVLSVGTNQIVGGNPTNLAGRIQLTSSNSLDLNNAHITGGNYLLLNAPIDYRGNSNSVISSPFADLNLGALSGSLTISNLLPQELAGFTGEEGAPTAVFGLAPMGGIQAFSGSYLFVDTNGVTNDVRVLLVNSALVPSLGAIQKDVTLHAPNDLTISDRLNIYNHFASDTAKLTITTNANSAYALSGALNLLNQNILLSASLPNLQYFTNRGDLATRNTADFAGNMPTQFSPRSGATAIQAFVNSGNITNEGTFIFANYFENNGLIFESPVGNLDISVGSGIVTNGTLLVNNGSITIAGGSLFISNSVITAGQSLTLTPSCSLSDGYVFGNMFGHITNATLPNVVTNGNAITVAGGVRVTAKPATADLLGTTITNVSINGDSFNQWAGEDRGASPSGFADNLALGRMVFVAGANPNHFRFAPATANNAIYVDSLEFVGGATNTDNAGNYTAFQIQPGMKIYYAQAVINGSSIAEKLNGKNGGGFVWVNNYAGVYSSTNLLYPDGNYHIFNEALVISPNIDSDGDLTVNVNDPTPIPAGLTFDISVTGPQDCGGGGGGTGGGDNGGTGTNSSHGAPGTLAFPAHQQGNGSGSGVSFALAQGNYNGLFYETNGMNPSSSGFFTAKVTSKGKFSAKVQLGAKTYSLSGVFNALGDSTTTVSGKGLSPLTVTLHISNDDQITGQVSGGGWTSQLLAVSESSANGAGKHSLVLSRNNGSSTTPSGDSFGTMTLKKNGDIQWTGVLPDGVKISQKSGLSKDGVWPLYSSLYGGAGSLIGWMQLTNGNTDIGGSAVWIVPAGQNGLYPNGLTNQLNATGSSLTTPPSLTHSTVILSGANLASPLTNNVTIFGKTGQSDDRSLTLSLDIKNGLFNGSVTDPDSGQTLSFQGALVEKSGIGGGFFLNANKDQGGKVYLAPAN